MKSQDITKLHQLSLTELRQRLEELERELAQAQLKKHAHKLDNRRLPDRLADDAARVKTVITHHQRQQAASSQSEPTESAPSPTTTDQGS